MYQENPDLARQYLFKVDDHWYALPATHGCYYQMRDKAIFDLSVETAFSPDVVSEPPDIPPGPNGDPGYLALPHAE